MVMEQVRPPTSASLARRAATNESRKRNASILASARKLSVKAPEDLLWLQKQRQTWQSLAWMHLQTVPEIDFAHRYLANVLSRLRIFPAWRSDPNADPMPMDPDNPPDDYELPDWELLASTAQLELSRLSGADGSFGEVLGPMAWNIGLVGECFLVGLPDEDAVNGERFDVISIDELHIADATRGEVKIRRAPGDNDGELLDPNTPWCRIWRRHPQWRSYAHSPMIALNATCSDLLLLRRGIRASAESRLNAGILMIAQEILLNGGIDQPDDGDGNSRQDPFMADLEAAMLEPIADPDAPSSRVPLLMRLPGEWIDKIKHLLLTRPMDEQEREERDELRTLLATGLDIPNEILLGMSDANHWTAWQVDEQTFKAHLEPLAVLMTSGIYRGFLRPALAAQNFLTDKVCIGYDATDLIGDEDLFDRYVTMHEQRAVSHAALRRAGGASEEDAPSEEELATWPTDTGPAPADAGQPQAVTDAPDPADAQAAQATPGLALVTGAALHRPRPGADLQRLATRLFEIDRTLRLRVGEKADHAVERTLQIAGGKARRRVNSAAAENRDPKTAELVAAIKPMRGHLIPAHVTAKRMLSLGIQPDDLIEDDGFDDLALAFTALALRAYRQTIAAIYREMHADLTATAIEAFEKDAEVNIAAGLRVLTDSVRETVHERLFNPVGTAPAQGEFDGLSFVRVGQVRESLAVAGGAVSTEPDSITNEPSGGIATGDATDSLLETTFGITQNGGRWLYGDPASRTRTFEPHELLDGVDFTSWDDPVLTNDEGWPDFPYYFPGDHDTCQCDYLPALEAGE